MLREQLSNSIESDNEVSIVMLTSPASLRKFFNETADNFRIFHDHAVNLQGIQRLPPQLMKFSLQAFSEAMQSKCYQDYHCENIL